MGVQPVLADTDRYLQTYRPVPCSLHLPRYYLAEQIQLLGNDVEVKFVVNLHYHFRPQTALAHLSVDAYHGYLHDVGGRSLNRGVDGVALRNSANHRIAAVDVRQPPFTTEASQRVETFAGLLDAVAHIFMYSREGLEIVVYQILRLPARNP